jgi:protein-S-isoprenylcysteine O-methyltransferase Ste14
MLLPVAFWWLVHSAFEDRAAFQARATGLASRLVSAGIRAQGQGNITSMNRWISPPVAFVIAAVAMWWIGRTVEFGRFQFAYQPALGIALIVLGLAIVAVSLRSFARVGTTPNPLHPRNTTELVTSGAYALSRNPMYVGDAVVLAGIAVWLGSLLSLVPITAFVVYIDRVQIAAEEEAMTEKFGDRYAAYRLQVRSWL